MVLPTIDTVSSKFSMSTSSYELFEYLS